MRGLFAYSSLAGGHEAPHIELLWGAARHHTDGLEASVKLRSLNLLHGEGGGDTHTITVSISTISHHTSSTM